MMKCKQCGHEIDKHYVNNDGKVIRFWGKDRFGNKKMDCSCRECEEYDAIHEGETY